MPPSPELVTVFNFREVEPGADIALPAPFKATLEAIESVPRRQLLKGTGEKVPRDALDEEGRYRRVATGWGELPPG